MQSKLSFRRTILAICCSLLFAFSTSIQAQGTLEVIGNGNLITNGDATPSTTDNTDFGIVGVGGTINKVFVLDNIAGGGSPNRRLNNITVSISGSSDFSPSNSNLGNLKGNGSPINHTITFNPSTVGTQTATVTITFNNGTNSPYTFTIEGDGVAPIPDIEVRGNGIPIASDGSNPYSTSDNTDYGNTGEGSTVDRDFTIHNTGTGNLDINGIVLGNPTDFLIVNSGSSFITAGGSTTITIRYNALANGSHYSSVTVNNTDPDEGAYLFNITGTATEVQYVPITSGPDWTVTNLTADNELDSPNEITFGPDDYLWVTERTGKKVVKVSPAGGTKTVMLDLSSLVYQTAGQDGLMGMAIHPDLYVDLNTPNNYVYLAYTYDSGGRKLRIERYAYNSATGLLDSGSNFTIIDGLDASNDHNSGRLKIGPDLKLYYTIGDQGANQFANACNEIQAQDLPTSDTDYDAYKGKVLRLNLDGTIPIDNPTLANVRSHVYTYGHRNAQGLIFGSDGTLYSSEHGPKVDDELNIITAGKNYGWPHISGYYDNLAYGYCNWSTDSNGCNAGNFSDHNCPSGVTKISEFDASNDPLLPNHQEPIGTYNSTVSSDPGGGWLTWPTVGPSSIDIYEGTEIPGWDKSLLITTLKRGTIFRAKLNAVGDGLESQVYEEFHSSNDRYRDITIDPNNQVIYAITDNTGGTSGPSGTTSVSIENPGVIVKIQYGCIIGSPCDDGDVCTTNDVYLDCDTCQGTFADIDNDTICDANDQCPLWDDRLLGQPCDDGDNCTENDIYVDCDTCVGTYVDADGDGVCAAVDPDDNDGCNPDPQSPACITCTMGTTSFTSDPLTHTSTGSSSTTLSFSPASDGVSFTISDLDARTGGKPSNRYIEQVTVSFDDGTGSQEHGTYSGNNVSGASINITGNVLSVTVSLTDGYDGDTNNNMSVDFSLVQYCSIETPSAQSEMNVTLSNPILESKNFSIFPNPVSHRLHINMKSELIGTKAEMYTITGQLIRSIRLNKLNNQLDVNSLSSGLYLLRISDTNNRILKTDRIIVDK